MREVNTRKVVDRLFYYIIKITQFSHCADWQIFPGNLRGFSARYNTVFSSARSNGCIVGGGRDQGQNMFRTSSDGMDLNAGGRS